MRRLALVLATLFALASVFVVNGTAQAKKPVKSGVEVPVTGTLSDGGSFTGVIVNPVVSAEKGGDFSLSGTLEGTAATADGVTEQVGQEFTTSLVPSAAPSAAAAGNQSCPILSLDVGAIFLDLLGLQVDLSPINLDVTAVPGAGNLLGNLLCAVTGLLDNPGNPFNAIANLLNQLLSGLFG
ncbi:hypothetical protein BH23ACT11_BH23ACT11_11980 [soil metagenome]